MAPCIESTFLIPIFTTALPLKFSRQRLHWSCRSWSKRYLSQKRQQAILYMEVVTDMTLQWYVLSKAKAADASYTPIWAYICFKKLKSFCDTANNLIMKKKKKRKKFSSYFSCIKNGPKFHNYKTIQPLISIYRPW